MPPAPSGDWTSYAPSLVPEVSAMARNYSPDQKVLFAEHRRRTRADAASNSETGPWEAPKSSVQELRMKANSLSANPQPLIALHSPSALLETGLRVCLPEKNRDSDVLRC